jgi:hypothetical protein
MLTTASNAVRLLGGIEIPDFDLGMLIAAASQAIEERCRRTFRKQEHTEIYDGVTGRRLLLRNYPIHAASVQTAAGVPLTGFQIMQEEGMLFRREGWPCGERSIIVSYTAGYVLPGDATEENPRTIPEALEYACILMIKHMQREPGVQQERVGDISVTYSTEERHLPAAVENLIAPFIKPLS